MTDCPDIPPWEPIAAWIARITNDDADAPSEEYEQLAKAIAYDIAMYDGGEESRSGEPGDGEVEVPDGVREQ